MVCLLCTHDNPNNISSSQGVVGSPMCSNHLRNVRDCRCNITVPTWFQYFLFSFIVFRTISHRVLLSWLLYTLNSSSRWFGFMTPVLRQFHTSIQYTFPRGVEENSPISTPSLFDSAWIYSW